jgi:hypothetical protein
LQTAGLGRLGWRIPLPRAGALSFPPPFVSAIEMP